MPTKSQTHLAAVDALFAAESIVSQDLTTQWQYILHNKLFCPYACDECNISQSYPEVITF